MNRIRLITAAAAFATFALPTLATHAAAPYDGIWQMNASGAGDVDQAGRHVCPPLHFTLDVQNGAFTGTLERAYGDNVTRGYDSKAEPVLGTIDPAGNITLSWEGIAGKGTATKDHMTISWDSTCGPRTALGEIY